MTLQLFRKVMRLLHIEFTETKSYIVIANAPCRNGCSGGKLTLSKHTERGHCSHCGLEIWSFGDAAAHFGILRIFDLAIGDNYATDKK